MNPQISIGLNNYSPQIERFLKHFASNLNRYRFGMGKLYCESAPEDVRRLFKGTCDDLLITETPNGRHGILLDCINEDYVVLEGNYIYFTLSATIYDEEFSKNLDAFLLYWMRNNGMSEAADYLEQQPERDVSMFGVAKRFSAAAIAHLRNGLNPVSPEVYEKRIAACRACPHLGKDQRCGLCRCFVEFKADYETEACPDGRWDQVVPSDSIVPLGRKSSCCG